MYTPETGARCGCKRGVQRDNCPKCEGTGWVIDFRAIHAAREARNLESQNSKSQVSPALFFKERET